MRLPRPRLSIRALMLLVAGVGAMVWGGIMWRRSAEFGATARGHAAMEEFYSTQDTWMKEENIARHRSLKLKYEHAARYPWLAVEPDPPEPKPVAGFDIRAMEGP